MNIEPHYLLFPMKYIHVNPFKRDFKSQRRQSLYCYKLNKILTICSYAKRFLKLKSFFTFPFLLAREYKLRQCRFVIKVAQNKFLSNIDV